MQPTRSSFVVIVSLGILLAAPTVSAQDMWRGHRGDCDGTVFDDPESAGLGEIARCVRLWEAYRDLATVGRFERARARHAMERLYAEGSPADAAVAKRALARLGADALPARGVRRRQAPAEGGAGDDPEGSGASAGVPAVAAARPACDVPKPSSGQVRVANRFLGKSKARAKAKDPEGALEKALGAVEAAPGHPDARYAAAQRHAALGQADEAASQLACMQDIGSDEATRLLKKSRRDKAFVPVRDISPAFKMVTGYARIKVGNGLGEYGEDNVDNLEAGMERLGFPIEVMTETDRPYTEPHIWYKPEVRTTAYFALELMSHPKVRQHTITWEEEFDIIIAWGDNVKRGTEPKIWVADPNEEPMTITRLERAQENALRRPEEFANKVDRTVDAPARAVDRVEGRIDRTERTIDRLERTGDKLKGLFD